MELKFKIISCVGFKRDSFSILFMYILVEGLINFPHAFLIYIQNNLEYLVWYRI